MLRRGLASRAALTASPVAFWGCLALPAQAIFGILPTLAVGVAGIVAHNKLRQEVFGRNAYGC